MWMMDGELPREEDYCQPLGADAQLGEAMLRVMVTSQQTKAALTQADL